MTLQPYLHTAGRLMFLSFNVFGKVQSRSSKIITCCRMVACVSGPGSESAKFYRLQLRLRLHLKQSTPTDSNSGLDSDFTASSCGFPLFAKKTLGGLKRPPHQGKG